MPNLLPSRVTKGRNKEKVELRNQKIVIRYYYWREIQRRRSDDVFDILAEQEFFLEQITLRRIIRANLHYFSHLKKEKPAEKKLQLFSFKEQQLQMFP